LSASGITDIGRHRNHNEDSVLVRGDLHLYLVADGAGGHNAGNVASALATTSLANYFEATDRAFAELPDVDSFGLLTGARRLAAGIQRANRDIVEIAKTSHKYKGMGTTVVAVSMSPSSGLFHLAHVGDSRCYRWRAGQLELLTHDHSLINDVLEMRPDLDDAALARLPRNVVTRALGMEESVRVTVRSYPLVTGDKLLLCSDGLTDALDHAQIGQVLGLEKSPDDVTRLFIDLANDAGANDNIATVVIACEMAPIGAAPEQRRTSYAPRAPMHTIVDDGAPAESHRDSSPEIVIVGDDDADVVPATSATPSLRDALEAMRTRK